MNYLFEQGDLLNSPYECFIFDTEIHSFPIHQHWHYYMEIIYSIEGEIVVTCDDKSFTMVPGDLAVFPPKSLHGISATKPGRKKYYVSKFNLGRFHENTDPVSKINALISEAGSVPEAPIFFKKAELKNFPIDYYFSEITKEFYTRDYGYLSAMHASLLSILLFIIRIWRGLGFKPSLKVDRPEDNALDTITEYIDQHSNQPLLVEDLAAKCNMSYSFFAKKFKQLYGRSCKEYIEYIRVIKAEDLLLFTDNDLTFISQETGFSDSSHMIKTFKKYKNVTPKQYRIQNTKKSSEKKL